MEPLFTEMTDTPRQARAAVQNELELLIEGQITDRQTLLRIDASARSFEVQAASLFQIMFEHSAD